ncbi:HNH endonuclease [Wohlfahrtiimonas larvae]|uniref:HNH endonuclease signature motif containing protein n=1 Tax=Wohlfahrtiimonas larvae TaxID=1157986 RepID=A0ABP9MYK3_9GAMM|nr:HNH endonuclease domain-containing protein [Wohlfahrtiimonas larvae]
MQPTAQEQLEFLQKIQLILEAGNFTSTYKFALLLALSNLSIRNGSDNHHTLILSYEEIAEQFIEQYWKQSLPFEYVNQENFILQQNTGPQIVVIQNIQKLMLNFPTLSQAIKSAEGQKIIKKTAKTIKDYPARFLQKIEGHNLNFLYDWHENHAYIQLKPNIMYCLRQFSGIIRQLVQQSWADFIRRLPKNKDILRGQQDIQVFLFDEQRTSLKKVNDIYMELQDHRCFYCQKKIHGTAEVDHFIPWSYYQQDTIHNFVIADRKCNGAKNNFLADTSFLIRWLARNQKYGQEIHTASKNIGIVSNQKVSENIAQWAYQRAINNQSPIWIPPKKFITLDHQQTLYHLFE